MKRMFTTDAPRNGAKISRQAARDGRPAKDAGEGWDYVAMFEPGEYKTETDEKGVVRLYRKKGTPADSATGAARDGRRAADAVAAGVRAIEGINTRNRAYWQGGDK